MMRIFYSILLCLTVPALLASCAPKLTQVKSAFPGTPEAIGTYTNGCLIGASSLPPDGPGYQMMRLSRGRFYGHPLLLDFLKTYSASVQQIPHGVVLIGDIAASRGGMLPGGHSAHNLGLEADIWYSHPQAAETRSLTLQEREELSSPSLVNSSGTEVSRERWNDNYVRLLQKAAEMKQVDRIFVHPAIKKKLCSLPKPEPWLAKIRPWWGHDDHFHVRLLCPAGDKDCKKQPSIPKGNGCDKTLDWWFTEEAKPGHKPVMAAKKAPPLPPKRCVAVFNAH